MSKGKDFMRVVVDKDVCVRCGMCVGAAPAVFCMTVDGIASAPEIPQEFLDDAIQVMEDCPVGAIRIV